MSRYNGPLRDLAKPFVDVFFLVFIALPLTLVYLALAVIYDQETAASYIFEKLGIDIPETEGGSNQ